MPKEHDCGTFCQHVNLICDEACGLVQWMKAPVMCFEAEPGAENRHGRFLQSAHLIYEFILENLTSLLSKCSHIFSCNFLIDFLVSRYFHVLLAILWLYSLNVAISEYFPKLLQIFTNGYSFIVVFTHSDTKTAVLPSYLKWRCQKFGPNVRALAKMTRAA